MAASTDGIRLVDMQAKQHDKQFIAPNLKVWSAAIVLFVIVSGIGFYWLQLLSVTSNNQRAAKVFEQSLVASIDQFEYLPDFLGQDSWVLAMLRDPSINHERLSDKLSYVVQRSGADDIFILNPQGTVVASSNYQNLLGRNFYGKNYGFRPYFKRAKSERRRQFYYAKGATTGIPGFFIASPVIDSGQFLGVVVVKLELSEWETTWRESQGSVIVADANGVIILSSKQGWKYKSIAELSAEQVDEIKVNRQFPDENHESLFTQAFDVKWLGNSGHSEWVIDHQSFLSYGITMQDTGWKLFHLKPQRTIFANLFLFLLVMSILGLVSVLLMREQVNKKEMRHKARIVEEQRRRELQLLIDNIHIGVVVFSRHGDILSMNRHAEHLLSCVATQGLQPQGENDPTVSNKISDYIDIQAEDFDQYLLSDIATPAYHETFVLRQVDSQLVSSNNSQQRERTTPVMFAIGKIVRENNAAYLMTIINITRRKKVEDQILRLNESLEETIESRTRELRDTQSALMQKNKAVALGNMAATIVHELSQPLAAINSSVAAIQSKLDVANWEGASESIGRLKPLSNKMNQVVKMLKHFSYENDESVELFSLATLVQQALDVLHDDFQEKNIIIDLTTDHAATPMATTVQGSAMKIDLAVSNILKNASDAAQLNSVQPTITIWTELIGNSVQLHIEDNGPGVDEPIMDQLFNPYFTTKEVGKGMGLGLSITYEIIQQHGGDITAVNTGHGARFSMSLPIAKSDAKTVQQPTSDAVTVENGLVK